MTGYNGFKNYETWAVNLWLTNEPHHAATYGDIANAPGEALLDDSDSYRGDVLKDYVWDSFDLPTTGLAADMVNAAMGEVDWVELVRAGKEEA